MATAGMPSKRETTSAVRTGRGPRWLRSRRVLAALSLLVGLGAWELIASGFSALVLPPPSAVIARMLSPDFAGQLLTALAGSLVQLVAGFALTLVLAIPLGILIGRSRTLSTMLEPLINALYAVPPVALVPFLIIWFGLFLEARIALVFLMSFPDVLVVVIAGARDIRRPLLDVGRSFGASRLQVARLVLLPAMLPFLFAALRVGSARAINGMITAELFFAAVNLGRLLKSSAQAFDTASAISVVVLICLLGLLAQTLINMAEHRVLHWHIRGAA